MSQGGGGVRKVLNKCHVLYEWPLISDTLSIEIEFRPYSIIDRIFLNDYAKNPEHLATVSKW